MLSASGFHTWTEWWVLTWVPRSLAPSPALTLLLAGSFTPSLPPSPTHSLTHPPTHSFTHSLTLNPTVYWACDYLSMLRLNLIHVSRMGPGCTSAQLGSSLARSPHSLAPLTHSFANSLARSLTRSLTLTPTVYWACDYLSMLWLNLIHVSRMGPGNTLSVKWAPWDPLTQSLWTSRR